MRRKGFDSKENDDGQHLTIGGLSCFLTSPVIFFLSRNKICNKIFKQVQYISPKHFKIIRAYRLIYRSQVELDLYFECKRLVSRKYPEVFSKVSYRQ